uniref:olfactory receptor 14L1-like n=1 Tax=Callospermophilus lateralis TaxID=76772 RepID=UPI0040385923
MCSRALMSHALRNFVPDPLLGRRSGFSGVRPHSSATERPRQPRAFSRYQVDREACAQTGPGAILGCSPTGLDLKPGIPGLVCTGRLGSLVSWADLVGEQAQNFSSHLPGCFRDVIAGSQADRAVTHSSILGGSRAAAGGNSSEAVVFLLVGFADSWTVQTTHAVLFLLVYLAALTGNLLIITVTTVDIRLQTPMYFFLRHLSFLDFCFISVTVPKSVVSSFTQDTSISFWGCALQAFFFINLASTETALLTVMSYDRCVAICWPLHYEVIMSQHACVRMMALCWLSGGISGLMHMAATFSLPFCGSSQVHHFFCDIPQLLSLLDSTAILPEVRVMVFVTSLVILCFCLITLSYGYIFSTVMRIPSKEGRWKTFSTCVPHLVVVTLFLVSGSIAYVKPVSSSPSISDLLLPVFYTVVPPTLNPVIYSLRNKELKAALRRLRRQCGMGAPPGPALRA